MPRTPEGCRALRVILSIEEHEYLRKMADGRKWRHFFKDIVDDARKAAELNQELRQKIELLEEQLRRAENA